MDKLDKKIHINFWYVIAAVLGMLLIQRSLSGEHQAARRSRIAASRPCSTKTRSTTIAITQNYISGTLKEAQPDGLKEFITTRVDARSRRKC